MRYTAALDCLNFFLADVRGGLGPYVGVFLITQAHWDQATLGGVLTVSGLLGITLHTPIGALIDATRAKRGLIVAGVALLAASGVAIVLAPVWPVVLGADIGMAVLGAIFGPTVAAITLGLVLPGALAMRLGRNAAADRAGNIFIAGLAGFVGWWLSQRAVFYLVPLFACLSAAAVLAIPARAIDHERARGFAGAQEGESQPLAWRHLFESRPLLVLATSAALFHFANAPMLPMLGQKLALAHRGEETVWLSASIVTAQFVVIPVAMLVGAMADTWGRKPILLLGFAVLPIRGVLYTLSDDAIWLVAVQIFDGISMGIYGTLLPLILADVMRGTGRYNVSQGIVGTVQGVGGSLSNVAAGLIVVSHGYNAAFLALAAVAAAAFLLVLLALPETVTLQDGNEREPAARSG
jgi:predicted MFS family arabinose efflux permease